MEWRVLVTVGSSQSTPEDAVDVGCFFPNNGRTGFGGNYVQRKGVVGKSCDICVLEWMTMAFFEKQRPSESAGLHKHGNDK